MTNEERLEKIKKAHEAKLKRNEFYTASFIDVDWLIEQAERSARMEMMYENTGSIMNRRHQIDKIERYEKALKEIAESDNDSSCNELALKYEVIAEKALES